MTLSDQPVLSYSPGLGIQLAQSRIFESSYQLISDSENYSFLTIQEVFNPQMFITNFLYNLRLVTQSNENLLKIHLIHALRRHQFHLCHSVGSLIRFDYLQYKKQNYYNNFFKSNFKNLLPLLLTSSIGNTVDEASQDSSLVGTTLFFNSVNGGKSGLSSHWSSLSEEHSLGWKQ